MCVLRGASEKARYFSQAGAIEWIAQRDPDNVEWQRELYVSYCCVGVVKQDQHDLAGAAQAYQQGLDIMLALTQRDPNNADWQRELYMSHWNIGGLREQQNDWTAAAEQYAQALAVAEKLQQVDKLKAADKGNVDLIRAALQRVRAK